MFFDDEESAKPRLWVILAFAFAMSIGVLLVVLAGVLFKAWWLILTAVIFLFFPVPHMLKRRYGDPFNDSKFSDDMALFWTGLLGTSGLALPATLLHAEIILPAGFWMGIVGGLVIAASGVGYIYVFHRKPADAF
jgi:hypothetical protein